MHLPMIMGYLLGTATRKDLLSLLYTHRVKAKDKLKCTYDNMFSAKIGEKKTLLSTSWKNWNKILKRKIMKWGWLQLKLDSKQYSLQNPLPLCCLRLIVEALSYLKLKIYFHKRSWHHLCVSQVTVLLLPEALALYVLVLIQSNKCLLEAYYMQDIFQMLVVE